MKCSHCNGECCYLDSREGTIRYAQILSHGKGVHFCKYCEDGTEKENVEKKDIAKILDEVREMHEKASADYDRDAEDFWNSMTNEDRLKCFYSVTKRIHQGELLDKGSYRYVLYDVFGFGPEAYGVGMGSGYFAVHNAIETEEQEEK